MKRGFLVGVMLVGCGGAYDVHTVAYDERHGVRGLLDLLVPEATGAPRLGLLLLHPGGWTTGDKGLLDTVARRLAGAGYVVANANYRFAPEVRFPRPLEDAWCALAFLRQESVALEGACGPEADGRPRRPTASTFPSGAPRWPTTSRSATSFSSRESR